MSKIKLLSKEDILKIAAGEVIQRPASIVKELIENSLDAGAKNIVIKIVDAGKSSISISDDGSGMSPEDAKNAVLPHTTSKISSVKDLYNLSSYGFRGEALASINAVSNLIIETKHAENDGIKLNFETGILKNENDSTQTCGTKIIVENLFHNIPVRKLFLKTNEVETTQIWKSILNTGLAHTNLHIKYFENEKLILNAAATENLKDRVAQMFDYYLAQNMIQVNLEENNIQISGLTSNLQINRYNKNQIFLFVNKRPFRDPKIINAICNGYNDALPSQRYPISIINIQIDPGEIDVNVHPAKEEVLFKNSAKIYNLIKSAINRALEQNASNSLEIPTNLEENNIPLNTTLATTQQKSSEKYNIFENAVVTNHQTSINRNLNLDQKHRVEPAYTFVPKKNSLMGIETFKPLFPATLTKEILENKHIGSLENQQFVLNQNIPPLIIGQLFSTYILFQQENKLCLVDQHAASERIIYEKLKSNFTTLATIKLLFPVIVDMNEKSLQKILALGEVFSQFGILFEQFGKTSLIIESLPHNFEPKNIKLFFAELLNQLELDNEISLEKLRKKCFEHMHSHIACKTAIKAGDHLNNFAMQALLSQLLTVENKFQCIHGRPTIFEIEKNEIEKWFFRR